MQLSNISLTLGDCLIAMKQIPDQSIDMILCDLPYGTTKNEWDKPISLEPLWKHYNRIIKDNGVICLFAQAPYDKILACSNMKMFRYEWIWEKAKASNFLNSHKMPMKVHENILVFYKHLPTYNPQMTTGHKPVHTYTKHTSDGSNYGKTKLGISGGGSTERYPRDVLKFSSDTQKEALHSTQKPVALCNYLIKTYTNENDVILDNAMGSGTTGISCINTNRDFIGIEKYDYIFKDAVERITQALHNKGINLDYLKLG